MQTIGKFALNNGGAFVASVQLAWVDARGVRQIVSVPGGIQPTQAALLRPIDHGIPDGVQAQLSIEVIGFGVIEAEPGFVFDAASPVIAHFVLSGTPLRPQLQFQGVY